MTEDQREIRRKKRVIEYAEKNGNIKTACRRFGIARSTFYVWRDLYRGIGRRGFEESEVRLPPQPPEPTPDPDAPPSARRKAAPGHAACRARFAESLVFKGTSPDTNSRPQIRSSMLRWLVARSYCQPRWFGAGRTSEALTAWEIAR